MTRELLALPRVAGKDRAAARVTSGACAHAVLRGPMGRWSARVQGSRPSRTDADTRRVARVRADGQGVVSYIPHPHRTYKDGCIECTRVERVSYLCRANVSLMPTHAVVRRDVSAFQRKVVCVNLSAAIVGVSSVVCRACLRYLCRWSRSRTDIDGGKYSAASLGLLPCGLTVLPN